MNALLARLTNKPTAPCRRETTSLPSDAADADDDLPRGCGWFDSSHELRAGLVVTEHASADPVAGQMPLDDWLHLHLGGWQARPLV